MSAALAHSYHSELIDGIKIEKPVPKKLHFLTQRSVLRALDRSLPKHFLAGCELNVLCGQDRLVPDIVVVTKDAHYQEGDLADPPLLAVEILSPGQTIGNLFDKAERMVRAGTPVCWILWPERRKAWEFSPQDLAERQERLTAEMPDETHIEVALADIWAALD